MQETGGHRSRRTRSRPGSRFTTCCSTPWSPGCRPGRIATWDASLFPGFVGANLRTSITRACKATGTPHFSPHGLRKRRGSLLSKQGYSLAEVSERLGDTKVVTAEHYLYALGDYTEVDYGALLAG